MDRGWTRVVVAATGPSFSEHQARLIEQAHAARGWRVIAINDAWKLLPSADVLYACDGLWWKTKGTDGRPMIDAIRQSGFAGQLWTQGKAAADAYGLHYVRGWGDPGLTKRHDGINNGKNSAFQAMNLAKLFGWSTLETIVTAGLDMQRTNGKQHFFGDHPKPLSNTIPFDECIRLFAQLAADFSSAGVDVVNCSAQTALQCFRRAPLEAMLC
jgi:hypothetical protein